MLHNGFVGEDNITKRFGITLPYIDIIVGVLSGKVDSVRLLATL